MIWTYVAGKIPVLPPHSPIHQPSACFSWIVIRSPGVRFNSSFKFAEYWYMALHCSALLSVISAISTSWLLLSSDWLLNSSKSLKSSSSGGFSELPSPAVLSTQSLRSASWSFVKWISSSSWTSGNSNDSFFAQDGT